MSQPESPPAPPANPGLEQIVGAIGPRIRQIRLQLGLSLQQLATRSEVSAAAIHKVERGDMVPTITTLLKLCTALDRPIGFFVDDQAPPRPVAVHLRPDDRPPPPADWPGTGGEVTAASVAVPDDRLRAGAVHATVRPGGTSGGVLPPRTGEELVLVQGGQLAVEVAGERYLLRPGDTLHYPTDLPHSWHNPGPETTEAVWWYLHD
jgi:transcriptional regulator with XRE-family HTH domain